MGHREVPAPVRAVVADSWRRCADSGIGIDDSQLPAVQVTGGQLAQRRAEHPLAPLMPMLQDLLGTRAGDTGHVFAVADADGTLLWVQGDARTVRRAERMHFVVGAQWAEARVGTNAPGTALAIGGPVQVLGDEHYHPAARSWSCSAVPVRDPDGGLLLGVLDLTGGVEVGTPRALSLVRAAARAAEAELARRVAVADARALAAADRLTQDGTPAVLVSPGGRVLDATPGLILDAWPGGDLLPDGRRVLVEPVGSGGHAVVRFVEGPPRPGDFALRLAALGRDAALLRVDGRMVRLRPRHSEILVVLASAGGGVSGGKLAVELSEEELAAVTLRAEMSRLRGVLGGDVLDSMPYRLRRPVRADFHDVGDLLAAGRTAEAVARYPGPLLPSSQAPAVAALRAALKEGAEVLIGGEPAAVGGEFEGGYYYSPTVLKGHNKMRVFQEEIFGPVLAVTTFKDEADALAIANDTPYGLGAGVWTRDGGRAYRMGRAIKAGRVWTNCYHQYPAGAAFGGYKVSGIGRETHKMMLEHYSQTKNLLVSYGTKPPGLF